MTTSVTTSIDDGVAVVRMDDGRANALGHDAIDALHRALDLATDEARAVCFVGREGKLCAGFDLSVMTSGADATRGLVKAGAELFMRIYGHPQPTVVACTGHALAAGALLLLACDTRIGADVPSKIGLNEVAIGMGMPIMGVELARTRLSSHHLTPALVQARIYDAAGAVDAGYLDRVVGVSELEQVAITEARRLGEFRTGAYGLTKSQLRGATIAHVLETLDADMANMVPPAV